MQDIEHWPDIRPGTGYPELEISRISGIRYPAKKVSSPTLQYFSLIVMCYVQKNNPKKKYPSIKTILTLLKHKFLVKVRPNPPPPISIIQSRMMFVSSSVRPSVRPSVRSSVCLSVRLSVCPSVRLSVCLLRFR